MCPQRISSVGFVWGAFTSECPFFDLDFSGRQFFWEYITPSPCVYLFRDQCRFTRRLKAASSNVWLLLPLRFRNTWAHMQWLAQKLLAPEDRTGDDTEFEQEMLHSAKILVGVEMLLQPSMYVLGLVLGLVHSMQHSVWGTCLTSSRSRLSSSRIGSKWRPWKRRHPRVRTLSRISWRQRRLSGTIREYRSCLPTLPWTIPFIGREWGQLWSQDSPSVCGPMTTRESGWRPGARCPRLVTWREYCLAGWACPWSWRSTPSSTTAFSSSHTAPFAIACTWTCSSRIWPTCPCFRPSWRSAMERIHTCYVTFECVWLQVLTFGSRRASWPCRGNRAVASRRRTSWFRCSSPWAARSTARCISTTKMPRAPISRQASATEPQVNGF